MANKTKPILTVVHDQAKQRHEREQRKAEANKSRGISYKEFMSKARAALASQNNLLEALKMSVVLDPEGSVVHTWTDDDIEHLLVPDPGPIRQQRMKS